MTPGLMQLTRIPEAINSLAIPLVSVTTPLWRSRMLRPPAPAVSACDRCHIHDGTAALLNHPGKDGARGQKHAVEIQGHDPAPQIVVHLGQQFSLHEGARVVDQCVQAPEFRQYFSHQVTRLVRFGDIGGIDPGSSAAHGADLFKGFARPGLVLEVVNGHLVAVPGKLQCRSVTYT